MGNETIAAIVGAFVGGVFAIGAGFIAQRQASKEAQRDRNEERDRLEKALLAAIDTEIRAIWSHYTSDIGKDIENSSDAKPIGNTYHVNGGYFRVYKGISGQLGLITDDKTRSDIISFYIKAEAMLDTIRQSNVLVHQYNITQNAPDQKRCLDYDKSLRNAHAALKAAAEPLLKDY